MMPVRNGSKSQLEEKLDDVEKFGFERKNFPLSYNGHEIDLLRNDSYETSDGRIMYDFTLYCHVCKIESGISERFPHDADNELEHVVAAKLAVFGDFYGTTCKPHTKRVK
jgi:hypothetical protein